MSEARLQREARFHDQAFAGNIRTRTGKFYEVARAAKRHYHRLIDEDCAGRRVLEYGCGRGSHAYALAHLGAEVVGIDLSREGILQAVTQGRERGLEQRLAFRVMDAEALAFPDDHFDLVCGSGILHHLDLDAACGELVRVLKPDGRAVFYEPMGHNPLINLYRKLTPRMRSEDEHPLLAHDLVRLAAHFDEARLHYYGLCTLMAVPLRKAPGFRGLLTVLECLDSILLRSPVVRRQAWLVVVELHRLAERRQAAKTHTSGSH